MNVRTVRIFGHPHDVSVFAEIFAQRNPGCWHVLTYQETPHQNPDHARATLTARLVIEEEEGKCSAGC